MLESADACADINRPSGRFGFARVSATSVSESIRVVLVKHKKLVAPKLKGCTEQFMQGVSLLKGKAEMHIYPTICDLVRISDTENQKRIRAGIALTRD